jgi:hypothetical protein
MCSVEINREALREMYPAVSLGCFIRKPVTLTGLAGIMSMSISYDPRTPGVGGHAGQTLEDFYRIPNLDEKRRKYLEDLRWQVNSLSTGGRLNNLLIAMGLDH